MKKVLIIHDEFEGAGPLYFDLGDPKIPKILVNYLIDNVELNSIREFELKEITKEEFDALEGD